jgi:hypothetical protein
VKKRNTLNFLNKKEKNETNVNMKTVETKIKFNDSELNSLDFTNAEKNDKRTYSEYYVSLIRTRHPLISSFIPNNDYNSMSIKICLFFFSFALSLIVNSLFFTDETMHKIYEDEGIFNFVYSLPKIIYSTIISSIIDIIMKKLALTEDSILDINKEKTLIEMKEKAEKIKRNIIIKSVLFFSIGFVLLGLFWFYIGCFCAVYTKTQIYLIKDTLISLAISMVTPFVTYLFPCIIRIKALNEPGKCLYKISKIL